MVLKLCFLIVASGLAADLQPCESSGTCDGKVASDASMLLQLKFAAGGDAKEMRGSDEMQKFTFTNPQQRCPGKPPHGWGNLGTDITESACENACLNAPSCKFVAWHGPFAHGSKQKPSKCTTFDSCDKPKNTHNTWVLWKKVDKSTPPAPAPPAPLQPSPPAPAPSPEEPPAPPPAPEEPPAPAPAPEEPPAPAPSPPAPQPGKKKSGDNRRWRILPGEVKWTNTTTSPDGKCAGTKQGWMKYTQKKFIKHMSPSQKIPVRKHGDPKGVEWCAIQSNYDSRKDLCDQVKAKYDEVESLEAQIYKLYINRSKFNFEYEHTTMMRKSVNQHWKQCAQNADKNCGETNEKLSTALGELAALNNKVTG